LSKSKRKNPIMPRLRSQYPLILVMVVVVAVFNLLGTTFAWFVQVDNVKNVIESKEILFSHQIDEDFEKPVLVDPGQTVEKAVRAENNGTMPGFVRLLVLTEIISQDGIPLPANSSAITYNGVNTTKWIKVDGWWYYLDVLEPGDVTPNLFSGVTLSASLPDEYQNAGMKIEVKMEASDIKKWSYREGWWPQHPSNAVPPAPFDAVDSALSVLTKP